ncbi:hypothetical protein [Sphingobium sp. CFD-2]|jgi:hypothetical protein|uniref:hypothetical protein n=1 Tax=Sphingobium sp. CFD-2 TaxID=2878542 RepID=UPI00214C7945|nr:hypothetical protein [Sphingobium sp. CFD-2]
MDTDTKTVVHGTGQPQRKLADWLWRPWFAKLWWIAIPAWWVGMAVSSVVAPLESFYDSALAGFLNVLFFPMTALMVLGLGFAQQWLARRPIYGDGEGSPQFDINPDPFWSEIGTRKIGHPLPLVDMYDPRSGGLFIGNPESFQHPDRS